MPKFKIDNIKLPTARIHAGIEWKDFLETFAVLKPGESFVIKSVSSNHRLIMSACKILMNRTYLAQTTDSGKSRIFRIK